LQTFEQIKNHSVGRNFPLFVIATPTLFVTRHAQEWLCMALLVEKPFIHWEITVIYRLKRVGMFLAYPQVICPAGQKNLDLNKEFV